MMEGIKQPRWKEPEYSRRQINNAGQTIRNPNSTVEDICEALKIIDNWRAAHAYPLHVFYINLRQKAGSHSDIIVAERLKRLDSIIIKLQNESSMELYRMQDLGGCRMVCPTLEDVYKYSEEYINSRIRHELKKKTDYIQSPKASGYRSLHLIYRFRSDKPEKEIYNRYPMLIELQFRTHLQHIWATAVETMGLFTKENIKSGYGSDDVKRFFVLTSALFAKIENQPLPPNVVDDINEIVHEIEALNSKHNYLDFLSGIRVAVKSPKNKTNIAYCILILNYSKKTLQIKGFNASQIEEANEIYNSIEASREESKIDAVLVRVSSINNLKKAYPNYFSDIGEFVKLVKSYLG